MDTATNKGLKQQAAGKPEGVKYHESIPMTTPTGIEALVCADIAARQMVGLKKYGQTLADNPAELHARLQHAYEECLDQACYLKWAMEALKPTTVKRQPKPGDRYTLGTMSVLVESVELDAMHGDRVHYLLCDMKRSELIDEFEKLAAKSIANGAVFHPANDQAQRPAHKTP